MLPTLGMVRGVETLALTLTFSWWHVAIAAALLIGIVVFIMGILSDRGGGGGYLDLRLGGLCGFIALCVIVGTVFAVRGCVAMLKDSDTPTIGATK